MSAFWQINIDKFPCCCSLSLTFHDFFLLFSFYVAWQHFTFHFTLQTNRPPIRNPQSLPIHKLCTAFGPQPKRIFIFGSLAKLTTAARPWMVPRVSDRYIPIPIPKLSRLAILYTMHIDHKLAAQLLLLTDYKNQ